MRLFGGKIGFVGSGIHSLSSQILSKSFRNWFENRTLRGTRKRLKFNGLQAFFFLQGTLFQPQSKPFYILCILHDQQVPHSLPTDFTFPRLILLSNHCFPTQNTNTASSAHEYNIIGSRIRYHWLTNTISSAHEYDMLFSPNQDRMGIV